MPSSSSARRRRRWCGATRSSSTGGSHCSLSRSESYPHGVSRHRLTLTWTVFYVVLVVTLVALIVPAWQRYSRGAAHADAAFRPPPVAHPRPPATTHRVVTAAPVPAQVATPAPRPVRVR